MAYFNRVKFATATTGTGPITVGAGSSGFRTPATAGMLDGDYSRYVIEDGTAWETGISIASSSAGVLSRVFEESSTGSLLNLSGSATMYFTLTAARVRSLITQGQLVPLVVGSFSN